MKDLLKKLLCVIMALTMVAALCACGGDKKEDEDEKKETSSAKDDGESTPDEQTEEETKGETEEETEDETEPKKEKTLVGEWEAKPDYSELLSEYIYETTGEELELEDAYMDYYLEFNKDGTFTMVHSGADAVIAIYTAALIVEAEAEGMEPEEYEEELLAYLEENEVELEEFMVALMEEYGVYDILVETTTEGYWMLDGDELYSALDEDDLEDTEPAEIELDEDEFVMELDGIPVTFERA